MPGTAILEQPEQTPTGAHVNGKASPIQIFAPFGQAYELMKTVLFRPFNFSKWCVIGFAAFLAGHYGGGGVSFQSPVRSHSDAHWASGHPFSGMNGHVSWIVVIVGLAIVVFLAVFIVLTWIRCRGTF